MIEKKNPTKAELKALFELELKQADPNTSILSFSGISGAMFQGYSGEIVSIGWEEIDTTTAPNVRKLTQPQTVTIKGKKEDGSEDTKYTIADIGDNPHARMIVFKDGKKITLGLLAQGKSKTVFSFLDAAGEVTRVIPYPEIKPSELIDSLVGKRLVCTAFFRDDNAQNNVIRKNPDGSVQSENKANCYTFNIMPK